MKYHMPAEWAPHSATWLAWPHNEETFPGKLKKIPAVFVAMVKALHQHEVVNILVDDAAMQKKVENLLKASKAWNENVKFHIIPTNDLWIRDYGPIFVKDEEGKLTITDWIFNVWGQRWEKEAPLDDVVPTKIAGRFNYPLLTPGIVLEGGSIDVNGQGTLLTTESCLLSKTRNPNLSREQIEGYLQQYLGVKNVLWLKGGIAGDDTSGHIDDLARFVNEDTVVCVVERDPGNENYEVLKENFERLQKMKDQDGKALKVIALPTPPPVPGPQGEGYVDDCVPASYANFYIANNVVLLPVFGSQHDEEVIQLFRKLFPTREIAPINCSDLVWGLGAIHCASQQQPR